MPMYDIRCTECGKYDEIFLKLAEFENLPTCCDVMMVRVIRPTQVMPDIQPYKSMLTGEMITSRSQHRSHLKQHRCIEIGNENTIPTKASETHTKQEKWELRKQIHRIMEQKGL